MKNKTLVSTVLIVFIFLTNAKSQQLIIELKTGISSTEFEYHWVETIKPSVKGALSLSVYNYSIGLSTQLYQSFYLKTQMGTNDLQKRMFINYAFPGDAFFQAAEYRIIGTVSIRQNYIEFLPEVRLTKKKRVFLNMGVGLNQIKSSEFLTGLYSVNNNLTSNLAVFPKVSGSYLSFLLNAGLNLKYKNIGLIFELGLRYTDKTDRTKKFPGMSFKQNMVSFGVSYQVN